MYDDIFAVIRPPDVLMIRLMHRRSVDFRSGEAHRDKCPTPHYIERDIDESYQSPSSKILF